MFYTIYKTTNLVNGKFYVGKHKTKNLNDGYLGSGKMLKRAISKYGIDKFHKEILHVCKDEAHMNLLERILVVPDTETNYNLCEGGKGGFGYINDNGIGVLIQEQRKRNPDIAQKAAQLGNKTIQEKRLVDPDWWMNVCVKNSITNKTRFAEGAVNGFAEKSHSVDSKKKISQGSLKRIGKKNGSYGTCWVTNGLENRKIKKEELDSWLELGYNKGRKMPVSSNGRASASNSEDVGSIPTAGANLV